MRTSAAIREEIESALSRRVPGALSPQVRVERVRLRTGIEDVDELTGGGFPVGAITEIGGVESSGRTTLAMSFLARRVVEGMVFAWVDVVDGMDPESAAAAGVDLERMLWVRCGGERGEAKAGEGGGGAGAAMVDRTVSAPSLGGGCGSPHPRSEVRGMPEAIGGLMGGLAAELMGVESRGATRIQAGGNRALLPVKRKDKSIGTPSAPNRGVGRESEFSWRAADRKEQVPTDRMPGRRSGAVMPGKTGGWEPRCTAEGAVGRGASEPKRGGGIDRRVPGCAQDGQRTSPGMGNEPVKRGAFRAIDQALRATDLLLQAGGFGVIVLDLGGVAPEVVWKIPMATWFRFRAAADRARACLLVLTQISCARSSAELVLEMASGEMQSEGRVMTGVAYAAKVGRQRFIADASKAKVISIRERKGERRGGNEQGRVGESNEARSGERRPPQPERTGAWHGTAAWAQAGGVADVRGKAAERGVRGRDGRTG